MSRSWLRRCGRRSKAVNILVGSLSGMLIVVSSVLVVYEVVSRYFLHTPHVWSLEVNIFLLIGATFLGAGYTQLERAHVSTDVLKMILPARADHIRLLLVDIVGCLFCAFFSWKALEYGYMVWDEGWVTDSVWAPPLWIPIALICAGMVLLTITYIIQIIIDASGEDTGDVQHGSV